MAAAPALPVEPIRRVRQPGRGAGRCSGGHGETLAHPPLGQLGPPRLPRGSKGHFSPFSSQPGKSTVAWLAQPREERLRGFPSNKPHPFQRVKLSGGGGPAPGAGKMGTELPQGQWSQRGGWAVGWEGNTGKNKWIGSATALAPSEAGSGLVTSKTGLKLRFQCLEQLLCQTGTVGPCAKRHRWPGGEKPNNETQTSLGRLDLTEANPPYTDFAVLLSSSEVETASLWCGLSSDCIYTTAATRLSKWKCELHSCNTIAQRSRCKKLFFPSLGFSR